MTHDQHPNPVQTQGRRWHCGRSPTLHHGRVVCRLLSTLLRAGSQPETVVPVVARPGEGEFPGLFLGALPEQPFLSASLLAVTSQWRSSAEVVVVDLQQGRVASARPEGSRGSWSFLTAGHGAHRSCSTWRCAGWGFLLEDLQVHTGCCTYNDISTWTRGPVLGRGPCICGVAAPWSSVSLHGREQARRVR